jgi:hypothetical protein
VRTIGENRHQPKSEPRANTVGARCGKHVGFIVLFCLSWGKRFDSRTRVHRRIIPNTGRSPNSRLRRMVKATGWPSESWKHRDTENTERTWPLFSVTSVPLCFIHNKEHAISSTQDVDGGNQFCRSEDDPMGSSCEHGISKIDACQINTFCRRKNVPTDSSTEQHCEHGVAESTVGGRLQKMRQNHWGQNHEERSEPDRWPTIHERISTEQVCQTERPR